MLGKLDGSATMGQLRHDVPHSCGLNVPTDGIAVHPTRRCEPRSKSGLGAQLAADAFQGDPIGVSVTGQDSLEDAGEIFLIA
jgi:hypothetical protein